MVVFGMGKDFLFKSILGHCVTSSVGASDAMMCPIALPQKATKIDKIFTLLLTCTTQDKSKVNIPQNFVAFSEYMYELYKYISADEYLRSTLFKKAS